MFRSRYQGKADAVSALCELNGVAQEVLENHAELSMLLNKAVVRTVGIKDNDGEIVVLLVPRIGVSIIVYAVLIIPKSFPLNGWR